LGLSGEDAVILKRHEKKMGIDPATIEANLERQAAAFQKKVEAAQKRGDMNEMMRPS
jgi:hypothetical protein